MHRSVFAYAAIASVGLLLSAAAGAYWWHQYQAVESQYVASSRQDTLQVADKVQTALTSIYQNIRTLSLLPSVRRLERHGENLSDEAHTTIQQIYNNLASSVAVSEVYFLPIDFDPEKIDPKTGHHEAPILAFDELIAPSHTDAADAGDYADQPTDPKDDFIGIKDDAGFPQVEIQEYRQLRQQLDWLKQHYPTLSSVDGMNIPMRGSPELITCDNTVYDTTHDDFDRSGIIQIVPFYGEDGQLRGGVAAIMRSNAYRDLLPDQDYALVNTTYGFATRPKAGGQEAASADWVKAGKLDPSLIYSEDVPITTPDTQSAWSVWVGHPTAVFEQSSEAEGVKNSALASLIAIALLTAAAAFVYSLVQRNSQAARRASEELEQRVEERTAESRVNAERAEAANAVSQARVTETSELNADLAVVVDRAIAGDFSARVTLQPADSGLRALAGRVNELISTFDRGIAETGATLSAMARTDLTRRVTGQFAGGLGQLRDDTNSVADRLTEVVRGLRAGTRTVREAMAEIASGTNLLSDRSSTQAARIEQTAEAVSQLNTTTGEIAARAVSADAGARGVAAEAEQTGAVIGRANEAMGRISASSAKISNIIGMIDDVAFQTNLLALNASVEAARAGEAGKGFAVVAIEVRRLAQTAAGASAEVKTLIQQATAEVGAGDKLVADATARIAKMLESIRRNGEAISSIAAATHQQSETIASVAGAIREIEELTRSNTQLVEESNAAISRTVEQADDLDRQVDVFVVEAPPPMRAAAPQRSAAPKRRIA